MSARAERIIINVTETNVSAIKTNEAIDLLIEFASSNRFGVTPPVTGGSASE